MKQLAKTIIRSFVDRLPQRPKLALASALLTDSRIPEILAEALRASDSGDHAAAEQILVDAMSVSPMDQRLPLHLSRIRYLKNRVANPAATVVAAELHSTLAAMEAEI